MLKRLMNFALCCIYIFLLICHPCVAEDVFDSSLASCNKLTDLPSNPPALLQLYQCNVLASVLQPDMGVKQVLEYIQSEHLQPLKVIQTEKDDQARTTVFFSPYYRIQLYGDPVERMDFEIALNEDAEALAAIPLSIDYTSHTMMNESIKSASILPHSVSIGQQEMEAHLNQGLDRIQELTTENPSLAKTLVSEMLQYALFISVLYPGMPMDDVAAIAQHFPLLQATPNADDIDALAWVSLTSEEDSLSWNWYNFFLGKICFFCDFENGQLIQAGYCLDYLEVSNTYLPENQSVFETPVTDGFAGYTFHPEIYVELTNTWVSKQNSVS